MVPFQSHLTCALCNNTTDEVGYRILIAIAICDKCVDRLIKDELQRVSLPAQLISEKVQ